MNLSRKSVDLALKQLDNFKKAIEDSSKSSVYKATQLLYEEIIKNCSDHKLSNYAGDIYIDYDSNENVGRVHTNNMVIIFNEMGTGITGKNNPHPNVDDFFSGWEYDSNNHGEQGWWYPTDENDPNPYKWRKKDTGELKGWTKGIASKRMFYDALQTVSNQFGDIVKIEIEGRIGKIGD